MMICIVIIIIVTLVILKMKITKTDTTVKNKVENIKRTAGKSAPNIKVANICKCYTTNIKVFRAPNSGHSNSV